MPSSIAFTQEKALINVKENPWDKSRVGIYGKVRLISIEIHDCLHGSYNTFFIECCWQPGQIILVFLIAYSLSSALEQVFTLAAITYSFKLYDIVNIF
jgi:hypothetical protein